jgi:ferredoxin-thioredoxin reductase catalytic chain
MLFLTPDNEFAGDQQEITLETIKEVRDSMG